MKTQMLKMAAVSIYKSVSNKLMKTDDKSQILDPITTIFKLCIISFKPSGIKISINENKITYQEAGFTQGLFRWTNGDKANDLHNLFNPINIFVQDEFNKNLFSAEDYLYIISLAKNGLKKLKLSYNCNPIIKNSINNYIKLLESKLLELKNNNGDQEINKNSNSSDLTSDNNNINHNKATNIIRNNINENEENDNEKEKEKEKEKNSLYQKFKDIWNERQVIIIVNTLKEIDEINNLSNSNESINKYDKIDDYILSITNILDAKDKNVFSIIKEIIAGD